MFEEDDNGPVSLDKLAKDSMNVFYEIRKRNKESETYWSDAIQKKREFDVTDLYRLAIEHLITALSMEKLALNFAALFGPLSKNSETRIEIKENIEKELSQWFEERESMKKRMQEYVK